MFYSPEDQLQEEQDRLKGGGGSEPKRIRLFYEGEPDTTKWAIPPPPDIFSSEQPNTTADQRHPLAEETEASNKHDEQPFCLFDDADDVGGPGTTIPAPELHLSAEVIVRVEALCAAQNDFERRLFEHRKRLQHGHSAVLRNLEAREIIGPVPSHEKEAVLRQHSMELERADKRAVGKLDELRYQQQIELQKLGVPGFYPSSNPDILKTQQETLGRLLTKPSLHTG
ncbi:hypothetical protein EV175_004020 [Coemansia sp. RSA 1933]|nr:hypothetical protein EV175_004020 [Coemansia sp. RSA 1933]